MHGQDNLQIKFYVAGLWSCIKKQHNIHCEHMKFSNIVTIFNFFLTVFTPLEISPSHVRKGYHFWQNEITEMQELNVCTTAARPVKWQFRTYDQNSNLSSSGANARTHFSCLGTACLPPVVLILQ